MARYEFKLPDIGEGIAEAEIVQWHVKVGDEVREDQQLADMMTDKATVEMESPVAGRVLEVAGEVGDQIPIGSVLVVIETEGEAPAAEEQRHDGAALADGMVEPNEAQEEAVPSLAEDRRGGDRRRDERRSDEDRRGEERAEPGRRQSERRQGERREKEPPTVRPDPVEGPSPSSVGKEGQGFDKLTPNGGVAKALASPAVRARARDLGIDLAQVKSAGDRLRHADLDAYLLYNGGTVSRGAAAPRPDEQVKVVGLR